MPAFWRHFRRNRAAVLGAGLLALVGTVALAGPALYRVDPWELAGRPFSPPSGQFPLGTDTLGRDLAAGLVHGARVSLLVGLVATGAALLVGIVLGALAGYAGGWLDDVLMRFTEFFQTIPSFILAVVLVAIFQPSLTSIVVAIAMVSWPTVARLVRGEFLALRHRDFVQACVALGMPVRAIVFRQILPNAAAPVIVTGSLMVATAILLESGLSFLGLGDPNVMSWGFMIGSSRTVLRQAWWMSAIPGLAILVTVLALNLVGEGLNDALNPRLRR
ncbi:MAG: ABC transporter permease [Candidatus Rokubacteria bacterium]|nr:ABC transporter permease [Candidatus Rokubacteria bacterium]MBI2155848.1 ABC transporter permease [Candidatus Rokubacteria bacterium]MBI2491223.1 ABC transporter permease [Candidatus Rokubacteria bacterium]